MVWEFQRSSPGRLLEVLSVNIFSDYIDDITSAENEIEGRMLVQDVGNLMILYNSKDIKDEDKDSSILPDGTLRLTGPFRCMVSPFGMVEVSLKEKRHNLQLCNGCFEINPYSSYVPFNKRVSFIVPGKHGYAVVNLMLYSRAVEAIVEISLATDFIARPGASLYGFIRAAQPCFLDSKFFQSTLFHASKEKPKEAKASSGDSKVIPLSRCMVAVPLKSQLIINTQLYEGTTEATVADGTTSFDVATSGSESRRIGGIMVKVSWLVDPYATPGTVRPRTNDEPSHPAKRLSKAMSSSSENRA